MAEFPKMPLWTDAYLADTGHLTTIEHGAYLLLLMAMWRSKETRLPSDDRSLAKMARLTSGQWARIKPTIMAFFREEGGFITQGRLTDEAIAVRRNSAIQSDKAKARHRKDKENQSAAAVPNDSRNDASLSLSLSLKEEEECAGARESFFSRVLVAAGYNPADVRPTHWMPPKAELEVLAWLDLPGMTEDVAIRHVAESTKAKGRAEGPKAFERSLRALSGQLSAPRLVPLTPASQRASPGAPPTTSDLDAYFARVERDLATPGA